MSNKQYIMKNGKAVEVSDELYKYLKRSDRKIKYFEKDLKQTNYIINQEKCTVKEIPSREDSLDRIMALGTDFADNESNFDEVVLRKVMLEQALEKLNDEERYLITQLFYFGRTERDLAKELKIPQRTLHDYKRRILCKLHEFLKKSDFF